MNKKKKNSVRENGHFRKLSLVFVLVILLGGIGFIDYAEASGFLYYYDKYNYYPGETFVWTHLIQAGSSEEQGGNWISEDYSWSINSFTTSRPNTNTLSLHVSGREVYMRDPNIYRDVSWTPTVNFTLIQSISTAIQGNANYESIGRLHRITVTMPATKTTVHTENVIGTATQYPVNGLHTDGFWYVRTSIVNQAPQLSINSHAENKYFGKDDTINIQGTVKDEDLGDVLSVKYTINGIAAHTNKQLGSAITANGSNQNFSGNIPIDSSIPQGTYTIKVWVEDNKGGKSTEIASTIHVDKTAPAKPQITLSSKLSKEDITFTITHGVEASGSHQSGISKSQYKIGISGIWTDYTGPVTISTEGNAVIYARTLDKVQNISVEATETLCLDKTLPYGTITGNPTEYTNEDVVLVLEAFDDLSGVKRIKRPDGVWVENSTVSYTVDRNGQYDFVIEDNAGNQRTITETVDKIDKVRPSAIVNNNGYIIGTWSNESIIIDLIYEDLESGLKEKYYKLGDSTNTPTEWDESEEAIKNIAIDFSGIYYLHYKAIDIAGNDIEGYYGPYKADLTFPAIGIVLTPDTNTKEEVSMVINTTSDFSGISQEKWAKGERDIEYFRDNGEVFNSPYELLLLENGVYTFYARNEAENETIRTIEVDNAWKTAYDNALAAVELAELNMLQENVDNAQALIHVLPEGWNERIDLQERLDIIQMIINIKESIENIIEMDDVKEIIDFIDNNLSDHAERNDLVENVLDKAIPIIETKDDIDYIQDIINTIPQPNRDILQEKLNERIRELLEDKLVELEDLINDAETNPSQDKVDEIYYLIEEIQDLIDRLPDGSEKENLQDLLDKLKDRIDVVQDIVNVTQEFNVKLDNARLDFSDDQATLILDELNHGQEYAINIVDLETNLVVVQTTSEGGIINIPGTKQGHKYRVELEAYYNGGKLAQRVFEKVKPDTIEPKIEYAYILNGVLNIGADDNYKLHTKPYAFRIINQGENIDLIENTVVDTQFGSIAWTVSEGGITSINFQENDSFSVSSYPKTVMVRVRDMFGNISNITLNISKANEALFGDVPQEIVDKIYLANNPPASSSDDGNDRDSIPISDNSNPNKEIVVVDKNLPKEVVKEITATLENENLKIDPVDTEANSQEGAISIDIKKELDKLNSIIKNQLGDDSDAFYRITVTEKETNRLVYTKVSSNPETLLIPNLKDSTAYNIKISLVRGGQELAFREVERMTYDKTPPVIERIIVKNNSVEIVARDNIALHEKAYQYNVSGDGKIANNSLSILLANNQASDMVQILVSNFGTNVWTEKSRLTGLDIGSRVRVIVRDHAENYIVNEFEVQDGLILDSINRDNPFSTQINSEIKVEDLMKKILEEYNQKNPKNLYDLSEFNKDNFTIKSSDPSIAYIEKDSLITQKSGMVIITLTDETTGQSYLYTIIVSKYLSFDRRIVVQVNSETDLARVFEDQLYKEFKNEPIYFTIDNGLEFGYLYESILKTYDEGIITITATNGNRKLPLYVVVVEDQYPESEVETIVTNVAYVVKVGDVIDIRDVSTFYDELYEKTDAKYLVTEVNEGILTLDNDIVTAHNEGIGIINIIDLAKNRVEQLKVKVVNLNDRNIDPISDIKGHWAEETIVGLAKKGIITEIDNNTYKPNHSITREEFLTLFSKVKTYQKESTMERRNRLPLELDNLNDNAYYVLDALNGMTMFELEYIFGKDMDLTKTITREEVAVILALAMDLGSNDNKSTFKDTYLSKYRNEIQSVREKGLMVGYSKDNFPATFSLYIQ